MDRAGRGRAVGVVLAVLLGLAISVPQASGAAPGVKMDSGGNFDCAIKSDGTLACFGALNGRGQQNAPAGTYTDVSAGDEHACAVKTDGSLACWGNSLHGALSAPTAGTYKQVALGSAFSCALSTAGQISCWGYNDANRATPPAAGTYTQISAGLRHGCALTTASLPVCWGAGQAGTPPATTFTEISAGSDYTCGVKTDTSLACWGTTQIPGGMPTGTGFKAIGAGYVSACAVRTDGSLTCWGASSQGRLDHPTTGSFTAVSVGSINACAVKADGTLACWGNAAGGGAPSITSSSPPNGTVGSPYNHSFTAAPAKPGSIFSVTAGALPPGLSLASDGALIGTPTAGGTFNATVTASNGLFAPDATQTFAITIGRATPTLTTTASAAGPVGATQISDSATLSGLVNPSGTRTITFRLYGPDDATCASTPVFTSTVPVNTNGSYTSGTYTPTDAGTYRWVASYSGDDNNNAKTGACNDANESAVIAKATPTLITTASAGGTLGTTQISDTATLSGLVNPSGTRSITFRLYGPEDANCSGAAAFTDTKTVAHDGTYTSANFTPTQAGTYRWIASYSGDDNNEAKSGACDDANESATIAKASPALTTTASAGGPVGSTQITDTANLSGLVNPSGTRSVTFRLYGPNDANCSGNPVFTDTKTVTTNGNYTSTDFTPADAGTYRWIASYSGDDNNNAATGACNDANESATISKATPALAGSSSPGGSLGTALHHTVTISNAQHPGGQITFNAFGPDDANCSGAPAFTDTKAVTANGAYRSSDFTPASVGAYRWTASYSGDADNTSSTTTCGDAVTLNAPAPGPPPAPLAEAKLTVIDIDVQRSRGSATLTVSANYAGTVEISKTKRVQPAGPAQIEAGGTAELIVNARGVAQRQLNRRGKVRVNPRVLLRLDGGKIGVRERLKLSLDG